MRRVLVCSVLLVVAAAVVLVAKGRPDPTAGPDNTWIVTVRDTDIDAAWEVVDADTGFTAMTTDTTLTCAYAAQSKFDSLRSGNPGVGTLTAIFDGASTADQTNGNNFLQHHANQGTVNYHAAVFGNAYSARVNAYMSRWADTDLKLATSWRIVVFAGGYSPGNPGVGKTQTIWSNFHSPQQLRLDFLGKTGFVSGVATDDGNATIDSVTYGVDVYDAAEHMIVFSCISSTLRLQVDGATERTKVLTNATSQLNAVDTLTLLGSRGGANDFRGRIDEFYLTEAAGPFDAEMQKYAWRRLRAANSQSSDSALVWLQGIRASDSTRTMAMDTVNTVASKATTVNWQDVEYVWLDSAEAIPILVWQTGQTPRQGLRDSIAAGEIWNPVAQRYVPDGAWEVLEDVTYTQEGAVDSTDWELRVYPNAESARSPSTGFYRLAPARCSSLAPSQYRLLHHTLPPYSYVAVYAKGTAANEVGNVILRGKTRR